MLHRSLAVFALAVLALLVGLSQTPAQPGGARPGGGNSKQLEAELDRLRAQIKELEAKLNRAGGADKKDQKGPPFGPGGFGRGPGGPGGFGKGFGGPGGGPLANLEPDKLKKILQLYDLVYGDAKLPPGKDADKGPGKKGPDFKKDFGKDGPPFGKSFGKKGGFDKKKDFGPGETKGSVEARIDRLINELEQLRRELKK